MKKWLCGLAAAFIVGTASFSEAATVSQDKPPELQLVLESEYQWTGVAVSSGGRIFVCYPSWGRRPDYNIGEVVGSVVIPFTAAEQEGGITSAESIVADENGAIWILDAGKISKDDAGIPKLIMMHLNSDRISQIYSLPDYVLSPDSFMSDVRIDNARGIAYITDSGHGGIIVLDLRSGEAWRALTDIPEVRANMQAIYFSHTGLFTNLGNSDGIELSSDKKTIYFSSLGGDILYDVPADALVNRALSVEERQKLVKAKNVKNVPADGMVLCNNKLYMGDLSDEGVWEFDLTETNVAEAGKILNLERDIRWASGFALAPDGSVYFTTSALNYPADQQQPFELYRMKWEKPVRGSNPMSEIE